MSREQSLRSGAGLMVLAAAIPGLRDRVLLSRVRGQWIRSRCPNAERRHTAAAR